MPSRPAKPQRQPEPARVLVVDDSRVIRTLLESTLKEEGYEVDTAEGGTAALTLLERKPYDVVVTDLNMPAGDGFAVLEATRSNDSGAEVIVLTGSHARDIDAAVRAMRLGAQDYLTKPLAGSEQLTLAVERALEKKRNREALREAQKMEAVGRLAGGIAHDFNNLLGIIAGCAGLMVERDLDERTRRDVLRIQDAVERASDLTRRLLAFSRRQVLRPFLLDLNTVLTGMSDILRSLAGEKIHTRLSLASALRPIRVDPGQLEQVIVNLVVNARDAMPEGGYLTIETGGITVQGPHVGSLPVGDGHYVLLAVSDTGIGMDAATRNRAFEPFFTTKPEGQGTGLGLAMVHGVVSQSGGAVTVYSEPGHGSTFKVYLPSAEGEAPTGGAHDAKVGEVQRGSGTILLVEDEDELRQVMQESLEALGYHVLAARDGRAALDLASSDSPIDLLLTDMIMPEMNGGELAREISKSRPGLKAIFVSGYADSAMTRRGLVPQDATFLQKPLSLLELSQTIARLMHGEPTT